MTTRQDLPNSRTTYSAFLTAKMDRNRLHHETMAPIAQGVNAPVVLAEMARAKVISKSSRLTRKVS